LVLQEYTFGPKKSGTINTYAVMKSGMKRVDSTGRSGPIPSAKAQKRLVLHLSFLEISLFLFYSLAFLPRNFPFLF
jgi:hypothetical protein